MSSFIGHALTGAVIYFQADDKPKDQIIWCGWLMCAALFLDIEYGLLWLFKLNLTFRITHSFSFCIIFPLLTLIYVRGFAPHPDWKQLTTLTGIAAYSHLFLDLLVGVYPLPLLWPFTHQLVKLPFGVLPSAGRLKLTNWYLYRNLLIELGILIPLYTLVLFRKFRLAGMKKYGVIGGLIIIFGLFAVWGVSLKR